MTDLIKGITYQLTDDYLTIVSDEPMEMLSSAVFNGGYTESTRISNVRVRSNRGEDCVLKDGFMAFCRKYDWEADTVGLMTAAYMKSFAVS